MRVCVLIYKLYVHEKWNQEKRIIKTNTCFDGILHETLYDFDFLKQIFLIIFDFLFLFQFPLQKIPDHFDIFLLQLVFSLMVILHR